MDLETSEISAPTPASMTDDSAPSSSPSSPEPPLNDDDGDFYLVQKTESQTSFGPPTPKEIVPKQPLIRPREDFPVDWLPTEILISVFTKLSSPRDLFNCLQVRKSWARCCIDLLWHRPLFTDWDRLSSVANSLQKDDAYWPYADLIRRLNLSNLSSDINDGSLQPFTSCKRIERLTLTGCNSLTDRGIIALVEGNRSLLALDITGIAAVTDVTIKALSVNCPRLQGLNITGCRQVTDESLVPLAESCKYLKRLKLNKCDQVTDQSISAFASRCSSMLEIDLQSCDLVTDTSISQLIQGGRYLRELRLAQCNRVTDNAFIYHPPHIKFESLRILDLTACLQLTDAAVEKIIESAPRLRILVLAKCQEITDRSVQAITKLGKNLHDIHLGRCINITDDALKDLVKCCNRIRYIDLAGCNRVTDQSVKQLATLPKLRRIGLVKCHSITDRSILALARAGYDPRHPRAPSTSSLERVHLSYCINITIPGIHELLNSCRKLTHLSLTGIHSFFVREDLIKFCREAPPEFNEEQRTVFCVFSGDGVNKLRDYLNDHEGEDRQSYVSMVMGDELRDAPGSIENMMQSTALDGEDFEE